MDSGLGLIPYIAGNLGLAPKPFVALEGRPPKLARRENDHRSRRIAGSGTSITAGLLNDVENNPDLQGTKWYGEGGSIGISGKMMRDAHVRKSIDYVTDPLRAATWNFKPASTSPLHMEQARYCNWNFFVRLPWDWIVKRIVSDYTVDGFSCSEVTDDYADIPRDRFPLHPGRGRGVVVTGIHQIPGNTVYRWFPKSENSLELDHIQQWQPYNDVERVGFRDVPADRILRLTYDQKGSYFAGMALLRSAYGAWKMKKTFEVIDAIKHERRGVGTPHVILPEEVSEEDIEAAERTLEQMRTNAKGYAIFPFGFTLAWDTGGKSTGTDTNVAISRCDIAIAHNVSAGFMLLGLTGGSGSYGLSFTQKSQYHLSTVGHSKFVGSAFTLGCDGWSPVHRLLELNYGRVDEVPTLEARNLPTRDWAEVLPQLINSKNANLITADDPLEDELRDIFQVGPRDPSTARGPTQATEQPQADSHNRIVPAPEPEPEEPEEEEEIEEDDDET